MVRSRPERCRLIRVNPPILTDQGVTLNTCDPPYLESSAGFEDENISRAKMVHCAPLVQARWRIGWWLRLLPKCLMVSAASSGPTLLGLLVFCAAAGILYQYFMVFCNVHCAPPFNLFQLYLLHYRLVPIISIFSICWSWHCFQCAVQCAVQGRRPVIRACQAGGQRAGSLI